jgi:outer membrane biosynthesis protein TonB
LISSSAQRRSEQKHHYQLVTPETIRVSPSVMKAYLLHEVTAKYPRNGRGTATVTFHVYIDKTGRVRRARLISGNPPFINSASLAVMKYHYNPYLLNKQPHGVDTEITIRFSPPVPAE